MSQPPSYILALDQGTTSSRAIVFDASGQIVGRSQQEYRQIFPEPGLVEHDAFDIWDSQLATARGALKDADLSAADIAAIGITNQRETTLIWDRETGKPIHNAIVWQDRRTSEYCDGLRDAGNAEIIQERNGLVIDAYFAGSKIRWLLDHVEGAQSRAEAGELAFGTVDTWLVWQLTGGKLHLTDVTNASRTMLFNLRDLTWDDDLLAIFDIPRALLPEIRSSSEVYGETDPDLLGGPIQIAGIGGDQHAALFGQACHSKGFAKNTFGTGCFMLMHTGDHPVKSESRLLTTMAWQLGDEPPEYALEGSIFIGGAVVQWLRDQLGLIEKSEDIEPLAETVEDNGGVYFVPAFAGLGAPHWDQYARGTITGLTRGSEKGHIARAALEGIAFQVYDILSAMEKDSGVEIAELRVDGGASLNALMMQFQSDLLGVPVVRPVITETTALGAAYLAGLAVGVWKDRTEIAEQWAEDARFEPAMSRDEVERLIAGWKRAIAQTTTIDA